MDVNEKPKKTILIMHQTVTNHDAIGNDIEAMYQILGKQYPCYVFAQNQFNDKVEYVDLAQAEEIIKDENNLIIYHHSVYWENGEKLLEGIKAKLIFRYHNITPGYFFEPYNDFHFSQCKLGREQTINYMKNYPQAFWLSDSKYNQSDLTDVVEESMGICAPFHKIELMAAQMPEEKILKDLIESDEINLLFVGRVAPNKGHLFLLEILRVFILNYHSNIKLRIVGKFDSGLDGYNKLIEQKIEQYHLKDCVEFIGEINDSILMSYYLGSDIFICASEHEGFCVPILEAQYFGLPIIALESSAVPDTGGKGQIILPKEAKLFAAAIKVFMEDSDAYSYIRETGRQNFSERFTNQHITNKFKSIMEEIIGE